MSIALQTAPKEIKIYVHLFLKIQHFKENFGLFFFYNSTKYLSSVKFVQFFVVKSKKYVFNFSYEIGHKYFFVQKKN